MPSSRSVQLRDQLVAAIREAEQPLSTDELRAIPPDWLLPWRQGPDVYLALRALERMGICQRVYPPHVRRTDEINPKCVYWRYIQDETFNQFVSELDNPEN